MAEMGGGVPAGAAQVPTLSLKTTRNPSPELQALLGPRTERTDSHASLSVSGLRPPSPFCPHWIPKPRTEAAPLGT